MDALEKLGGRKFVLAIISLVAGLLTHALSPKGLNAEVVGLIVGIIGTFSAANAYNTAKTVDVGAPAEPVVAADNSEQLNRIETTVEAIGKSALSTQQILVNAMQGNRPQG